MTVETKKAVDGFFLISERVMILRINTKPVRLNVLQVHTPTTDKPVGEINAFYEEIDALLKLTKKEDITIIMGDFNAKIGRRGIGDAMGAFGLGDRNKRGDTLVDFCFERNLK
ncbi:hypothetical protein PGB90_009649 [Kerria lacca]